MAVGTLATKYRPKTFEEVTGQTEIVAILKNQIETKTVKNCYLFTGPSGTGKTTLSRIIARELNGGDYGITELDAASHNGVEDVRGLIEKASYMALDTEYRVFIIDECHSFSNQAWQAFLKTLEEPPQGSIFMFCTTDPQKIPDTILNRVQRFDLQKISQDGIIGRLKEIVSLEQKELDDAGRDVDTAFDKKTPYVSDDAVEYISKIANGGMRDAIAMMDKCLSLQSIIELEDAVKVLGSIDYDQMFKLFFAIYNCEEKEVIEIVEDVYGSGKDLKLFVRNFVGFILDICKYKVFENDAYIRIPKLFKEDLDRTLNADGSLCKMILDKVNELSSKIKYESNVLPIVETDLLLLCKE